MFLVSEHPGHNSQRSRQTFKYSLIPCSTTAWHKGVTWTQSCNNAMLDLWSATTWQAADVTKAKGCNNSFPWLPSCCLSYKTVVCPKWDFTWHGLNLRNRGRGAPEQDTGGSLEAAAHLYYFLHFPSLNSSDQPCSEQPSSFTDGTGRASEATHFVNWSAMWVLISTYPS